MNKQNQIAGFFTALFVSIALSACALMQSGAPSAAKAELASTGKVRVALINVANFVAQPAGNPPTGMGVDLGKAIAARVGAPFEPVLYQSVAALLADARSGKWDVALLGVDPARGADFEFTRPYALVQNTYLVPTASSLMTISDVDRKGVKVVVAARSAQHNYLKANLKQAELGTYDGDPRQALPAGKLEALAANRGTLEEVAASMPGYRIIPGSFSDVKYGVGVPKGRVAAASYLDGVIADMLASGAIAEEIARAKLKGVSPAK